MARHRKKIDMGDLRKEYSRLRSIARKRLERIGKSEFNKTETYLYYRHRFPTLETLDAIYGPDSYDKLKEITDYLKRFLSQRRSTLRGLKAIRKESLNSLHANGFEFLNVYNWHDWVEFIMWWKDTHPDASYGSPKAEELKTYLDDLERGMSPEQAKKRFLQYEDYRGHVNEK